MTPPDSPFDTAPLLAAWTRAMASSLRPFTVPGHKRSAERVWPELGAMLRDDVPLYGGLDTVKDAAELLARAEQLGATAWGGNCCRYLTGGSTEANQVTALALGRPGDTVLVGRSAHRSTVSALALAGLRPVWIPAEVDERIGLPAGLSVPALRQALVDHPDAVGLLCVEPSYVGTIGDLGAVVAACHARDVPVVVDQAWAGHLGFHSGYPPHALQLGADAMVISAHKALAGYSQAAFVVARTDRIDGVALDRAADALETTSPAGTLLASCDASRALLTSPLGKELLGQLLGTVRAARADLRETAGLVPLEPVDFEPGRFDPAKLVIRLRGIDGLAVERDLIAAGLPVEQADRDTIVPIVTVFDDPGDVAALTTAIRRSADRHRVDRPPVPSALWRPPAPTVALEPRDAFFADHEIVPAPDAVGRVSADIVAPYPPGIPVLAPGEVITAEIVELLAGVRDAGTRIAYATDPTLASYRVITSSDDADAAGPRSR